MTYQKKITIVTIYMSDTILKISDEVYKEFNLEIR